MKKNNKKILIFNINWIGDCLFSTATIRNIRYNYPGSFISCIIPSSCYPVLKGNPHLNEIIIFDERDRHRGLIAKLDFIWMLRNKKFDIVFLLHRSWTRALICFLSGIPKRIGYDTKKRGIFLTKRVRPPDQTKLHRIDYYLGVIEGFGLKVEDRYPDFFISEEDSLSVENFLKKHSLTEKDFLVVLNPGGNWIPKRWPVQNWARLADMLIQEMRAKVIIAGSLKDGRLARQIKDLMKEKPIIASGTFNLKELAALCRESSLFITADTGPLHIANAAGAKQIIALFGPTDPGLTGPFPLKNITIMNKNVGCKIPCYVVNCPDNRCMQAITADEVMEEVKLIRGVK